MEQRINDNLDRKSTPVVALAENEMPTLTQAPSGTPIRNLSTNSADSFDFSEIEKMMNRIGGKCFAPAASTDHHMGLDSEIWKGVRGTAAAASPNGYENHRAPITETVSWEAPTGSDTGYSGRNRRSDDLGLGVRRNPFRDRQQDGQWVGVEFSQWWVGGGGGGGVGGAF